MTTYMEFNRDLFLCNTLQPADASFSSLLFENTTGNNVITYNNLKNATFYFIPKDPKDVTDQVFLTYLGKPNKPFENLDDFISYLQKSKYIISPYKNPPYEISGNVYDFLSLNKITYEIFLNDKHKYPIDKYIYAYTFGKLTKKVIEEPILPEKIIKKTYFEGFTGNKKGFGSIGDSFKKVGQGIKDALEKKKKAEQDAAAAAAVTEVNTNLKKMNKYVEEKDKDGKIRIVKDVTPETKAAVATAVADLKNKINFNIQKFPFTVLQDNKLKSVITVCSTPTNTIAKCIEAIKPQLGNIIPMFQKFFTSSIFKKTEPFIEGNEAYYKTTEKTIYQLSDKLYPVIDISCAKYPINAVCSDKTDKQDIRNCEICKNFAYRDWYDANNQNNIKSFVNHDDSKQEYFRTWIQTCNLGIGIILLSIGIYYQQS